MKEAVFVRQNLKKWRGYEENIGSYASCSADSLTEMYLDLVSDLAYSQSQYPESRVTVYLNNLTSTLHDVIYVDRKKDKIDKLKRLFSHDIPCIVADAHFEMKLSFFVFFLFVIGGVILAVIDEQNIIQTLGAGYVQMTLNNIENGVPTDVYGNSESGSMFMSIFFNNLTIDLKMFGSGVIPYLGPGFYLFANGKMLGEFQTLFFLHGVGFQSMTAIWIHGTIEISTIIICAAASFALGKGLVFPHSYSRIESFKQSGLRSVKILCSVMPLTFLAAVLESFVTRHVEFPLVVKLLIIFGSLAFILFYYVYLPHKMRKNGEV